MTTSQTQLPANISPIQWYFFFAGYASSIASVVMLLLIKLSITNTQHAYTRTHRAKYQVHNTHTHANECGKITSYCDYHIDFFSKLNNLEILSFRNGKTIKFITEENDQKICFWYNIENYSTFILCVREYRKHLWGDRDSSLVHGLVWCAYAAAAAAVERLNINVYFLFLFLPLCPSFNVYFEVFAFFS